MGSAVAVQFMNNDHLRVNRIEDRLKKWHAQMGEDSKTQIRPLTRYVGSLISSSNESNLFQDLTRSAAYNGVRTGFYDAYDSQSKDTLVSSRYELVSSR